MASSQALRACAPAFPASPSIPGKNASYFPETFPPCFATPFGRKISLDLASPTAYSSNALRELIPSALSLPRPTGPLSENFIMAKTHKLSSAWSVKSGTLALTIEAREPDASKDAAPIGSFTRSVDLVAIFGAGYSSLNDAGTGALEFGAFTALRNSTGSAGLNPFEFRASVRTHSHERRRADRGWS